MNVTLPNGLVLDEYSCVGVLVTFSEVELQRVRNILTYLRFPLRVICVYENDRIS